MKVSLHPKRKINSLIFIGIVLFIVASIIFFIPYHLSRNILTVSFYGLHDKIRLALEQTLTSLTEAETDSTSFDFIILDDSSPLADQITKKMDLVFTFAGKNAQSITPQAISVNTSIYNNFPRSIGKTGISPDGSTQAVPLLLDHFEAAYNTELLRQFNGGAPLRSFEQLSDFAHFAREIAPNSGYPITIAGGDDETLLLFITALVESHYGIEGYTRLVDLLNTEKISSQEDFSRFIAEPLIENTASLQAGSLRDILNKIVQWQNEQLIHPEWLSLTSNGVVTFMELQKPALVFMPLSFHRTIPLKEIRHYTASWFPSGSTATSRSLVIPTVLGIALSEKIVQPDADKENAISAVSVLTTLASENVQAFLNEKAELATVHSTAQALDKQASDVRLWAASSESLLPSIGENAFETPAEIAVFTEYLRTWFKNQIFVTIHTMLST